MAVPFKAHHEYPDDEGRLKLDNGDFKNNKPNKGYTSHNISFEAISQRTNAVAGIISCAVCYYSRIF